MTALSPFIPDSDDLRPFSAEIWLIIGIAANLLLPLAVRRPNRVCAGVTLAVLLMGAGSLLGMGQGARWTGPHLRGLLLFDSTAYLWKLILLLFVAGVVLLWLDHSGRKLRQGDGPEFFVLLLGATLGMCLMGSTTNLLMVFMAIAMASLPSYLLAGFSKGSKRAAEASLKYVLFGAVTGAILIYGISFLYGMYGTLQLTELVAKAPVAGQSAVLSLGLIALVVGIGFKISAVPLHLWCPDVFEGASMEVTTFLSVASKGAALVLLLRLVQLMGGSHLGWLVGAAGALTATVGNAAAFAQTNIKRLLAYSSIAQAGYMLCLVAVAGSEHAGAGSSAGSGTGSGTGSGAGVIAQALLIYLMIYAVMNLGAFAIAAVVIRQSDERLESFAGLGRSSPFLAAAMFCCLISLIGLPPFGGFGAKLNGVWVIAQQGIFGRCLLTAVLLNTALSAFYYFRLIKIMYLQPAEKSAGQLRFWTRNPMGAVLGCGCAAALVLMFFGFGWLYTLTSPAPAVVPGVVSAAIAR